MRGRRSLELQLEALVHGGEAEVFVKADRVRAGLVRRQLHKPRTFFARTFDHLLEEPGADTLAGQFVGDAHALDHGPRTRRVRDAGNEGELQDAEDAAVVAFDYPKLVVGILVDLANAAS